MTVLIFAMVVVLSIPIVLPHLFEQYNDFHILLHLSGIGFASFLTIVAAGAYKRDKTRRLFFTTIAFGTFILAEVFWLIDAAWQSKYYFWTVSSFEAGHVVVFFALLMFALSVFRRD